MVPDALVILKLDVEHIEEAMQNMLICLRDGGLFWSRDSGEVEIMLKQNQKIESYGQI